MATDDHLLVVAISKSQNRTLRVCYEVPQRGRQIMVETLDGKKDQFWIDEYDLFGFQEIKDPKNLAGIPYV